MNPRQLSESEVFLGRTAGGTGAGALNPQDSLYRQGALLKIPSLVFDLDLEDSEGGCIEPSPQSASLALKEDPKIVTNFLVPSSPVESQISQDLKNAAEAKGGDVDASEIFQILSEKGYYVTVRTAIGGGEGSECLRNLRHNFVIACPGGRTLSSRRSSRIIIDPQFKEQFVVAKSTDRYQAFLELIPSCLVMFEDSIAQLVTFLCSEMSAAFQSNDAILPPWRQVDSMLSKWQPRNSIDETFARPKAGSLQQQTPQSSGQIPRETTQPTQTSTVLLAEAHQVFKGGDFGTEPVVK
eukprot:gene8128-1375_t